MNALNRPADDTPRGYPGQDLRDRSAVAERETAARIGESARTIAGGARSGKAPSILPTDPDHVLCQDYHGHATEHARDGDGWRCRVCQPRPGDQ